MTTATAPGTGSSPSPADRTGELLRRLFDYLAAHTVDHPVLLPALTDLDAALTRYLSGDADAGARAVAVYHRIGAIRQAHPAVPAP